MELKNNEAVALIDKIQEMTRRGDEVKLTDIDGSTYYDAKQHQLSRIKDFSPAPVIVRTLSGLAQIINGERENYSTPLFVIVNDHLNVSAVTTLLDDLDRDTPYEARADLPAIHFGTYMPVEDFIIMLHSKFVQGGDVEYLTGLLVSVSSTEGVTLKDDGVTQCVQAQKGVALKERVETKPIVCLRPFRTFVEVEQPESEFLFRIRETRGVIEAALFEADGGAWKNVAMNHIMAYLERALEKTDHVAVIA